MPDRAGLIDTSVIIDLGEIEVSRLPETVVLSAISLAELATGPHATDDLTERAKRQQRLQVTEASLTAIPFGPEAARAYGLIYAAATSHGRKARGRRAVDLLIAAAALAESLPLYTRNPSDFEGLETLIKVVAV